LHPNIAPYGELFVTKDDRQIVLAIGSNKQFGQLCKLLGTPDLLDNDDYRDNQHRVINRVSLKEALAAPIARLISGDLLTGARDKHIPMGLIKDMKEVFEGSTAQGMVLEQNIDGVETKRVRNVSFHLVPNQ